MSSKIQSVALLLPAFVLVTGLASAQPGVKVSSITNGTVSTTTINNSTETNNGSGPASKAPAVDSAGRAKYWDGTSSTDFYNRPPYISAPPNPQIAVGPDDILTIVNRTISRYPNPNAGTNTGVANPYNNPPTEQVWLDVWLGLTILSPQGGGGALCPSGTGSNSICVIDNASIRYDQLQGRYVVLFTVTDMQAHRSNFVLVVSKSSQFQNCATTPATCVGGAASSPFFTAPAIAPIVGGTGTGGANGSNWVMYTIPINLAYNPTGQPSALGLINANGTQENVVSTANTITTGGTPTTFLTSQFCTNGGPAVQNNGTPNFALARTCTNYFPTGARMGLDNDNIILTAPVLDQAFNFLEGQLAFTPGQAMGPYSGTRVVSVSKLVVYNGTGFVGTQPPICISDNPSDCSFVNLSDNTATGTLTAISTTFPNINCTSGQPVIAQPAPPATGVISACGPVRNAANGNTFNPLPRVFWEPDNLRGRALASFDAQVAPYLNQTAGVITPIDYLVGTQISSTYGANNTNIGSTFFIQPVVYSCPGNAIFPGPAGVAFCGSTSASQVSDLPLFGPLKINVHTLGAVGDPAPVGQGIGPTQMTANDGSSTTNKRLYVGDSRPQQVIFREGLLYTARNVRQSDFFTASPLGTSTVLYDIIKSCANAAPLPNCGTFSVTGAGIGNPTLTLETEWFNGQNVPDPGGNINGFGFFQPMFEVPADVISSGPVSPINLLPWFDKLFVGMTTGGTSNVAATFSKNLPSLWDFRPGDDAYDTALPYLDPYFGNIVTNVSCSSDLATTGSVVNATRAVTVADTTGLSVGMFVSSITLNPSAQTGITAVSVPSNPPTTIASISGNVVTLSANVTVASNNLPNPLTGATVSITFSRTAPNTAITLPATQITQGSNVITLSSVTGLVIGSTLNIAGGANVQNQTTTNNPTAPTIGPFPGATTNGSVAVTLAAANPAILVGMPVSGPTAIAPNTTVAAINGTALTLSVAATATAAAEPLTFTTLVAGAAGASSFTVNSITNVLPGAVVNGGFITLTSTTTNTSPVVTIPAGSSIAVGEAVSGPGIPAGTTVLSFVGNNVTLSNNATASSTTAALNFGAASATVSGTTVNGSNVITGLPAAVPVGSTVTGTGIPGGTVVTSSTATTATLNNNANAGGTNNLTFVSGTAFAPGTTVVSASSTNTPTGTINSVTISAPLAAVLASGRTVTFVNANNGSSLFFPGGATVVNIQNTGTAANPINTVTLNVNAAATLPAGQTAQLSFLVNSSVFQVCPMIPFSTRGGASTDPNDGSLWLYGEFAKNRLSTVPGPGEWGTSVANYPLSFPVTDPYNNDNTFFQDVQPAGSPASGFFTWIQIAKNLGIAVPAQTGPCTINNSSVPPIQQPPAPGTTPVPGTSALICPYFLPDFVVTRAEMAYWVVKSQMDEAQVTQYLCATGGDPTQACPFVSSTAASASSFSDTTSFVNPFISTPALGFPGVTSAQLQRYIEVMYRRGYTKGCGGTDDPQRRYCPDLPVKRQEMAVFLIRAKMNNVFPTSLSGIPVSGPYGDNFGAFNQTAQYFSDVVKTGDPSSDYFIYIQKMRELRITNGTSGSTFSPAASLTRKEIATFVVRAFFL